MRYKYNNISTSLFLWHCCTTCNLHSASAYLYIMQIKTVPHSSEDICWCLHLAIAVVTKDFYLGIHISNLKMWNFSPFFIKNNICEIQWCQSDLKSGDAQRGEAEISDFSSGFCSQVPLWALIVYACYGK